MRFHLNFDKCLPISDDDFPISCGVYCVFAGVSKSTARLVYIGKANHIEKRIDQHERDKKKVQSWKDTARYLNPNDTDLQVSYAYLDSEGKALHVEAAITFRLQPPCNEKNKKTFNRCDTTIEMDGPIQILNGMFDVLKDSTCEEYCAWIGDRSRWERNNPDVVPRRKKIFEQ